MFGKTIKIYYKTIHHYSSPKEKLMISYGSKNMEPPASLDVVLSEAEAYTRMITE